MLVAYCNSQWLHKQKLVAPSLWGRPVWHSSYPVRATARACCRNAVCFLRCACSDISLSHPLACSVPSYRAARNRISSPLFAGALMAGGIQSLPLFPLYLVSTSPLFEHNLSSVAECEPISSFSCKWENESFFKKKKSIYLCIWLCWILAVAHRVLHLHWSMRDLRFWHVGSSSLTRDWTHALALGVQCVSHWITREIPENEPFITKVWRVLVQTSGFMLESISFFLLPYQLRLVSFQQKILIIQSWRRKWQPTPVFLPGKPMDRGAWRATVRGVSKSRTRLSN